jgi:transcriptional regulator with XRE-family HTH domain
MGHIYRRRGHQVSEMAINGFLLLDGRNLWSAASSGSHGYALEPSTAKEYLQEIFSWTHYSKQDIAGLLGIARATLYNYLDGENTHSESYNKIVHLHLLITSYVVEGGDINIDFMRASLPDGSTLASCLDAKSLRTALTEQECHCITSLVQRSNLKTRAKSRLATKFA